MSQVISIASPQIGEEEKRAILEVCDSGNLAQGPRVAALEEKFAAMCGVKHAVATSSGTTALHTALLAHGIGKGDEVITTPFTFIASANSIRYTGARPVFADIERDSYNLDPAQIEEKITARTRAIMPVHLYGNPCAMDEILEIAQRHNLIVLEDASQAHGAEYYGQKVGTFGTACFSFYPTKNMTTGEGGMITTNDDSILERCRLLRAHGASEAYHHVEVGYNFRMTDIAAAIGLVQLEKLEQFNQKRIANADYLSTHLEDLEVVLPVVHPRTRHVFHQYTIRIPRDRDQVLRGLRERGVGAMVYYPIPVHRQPIYRSWMEEGTLEVSEQVSQEVLSLPVHPGLTESQLDYVIQSLRELLC